MGTRCPLIYKKFLTNIRSILVRCLLTLDSQFSRVAFSFTSTAWERLVRRAIRRYRLALYSFDLAKPFTVHSSRKRLTERPIDNSALQHPVRSRPKLAEHPTSCYRERDSFPPCRNSLSFSHKLEAALNHEPAQICTHVR